MSINAFWINTVLTSLNGALTATKHIIFRRYSSGKLPTLIKKARSRGKKYL